MSKIMKNGIEYGTPDTIPASNVSFDNTQSGLPFTNVQNLLNDMSSNVYNSDVLSASWKVTSSSAVGTALTNTITLSKGLYIVMAAYPVISNSAYFTSEISGSTTISKWGGTYIYQTSQQSTVRFIYVYTNNTTVQLVSAQSTSCTFSNTDRGGIFAYKITNVNRVL